MSLTRYRIVKAPFREFQNYEDLPIPSWFGEACIGLELELIPVHKYKQGTLAGREGTSILPDVLVDELRAQNPQARSLEAAQWLDDRWVYGGGIPVGAECFEAAAQ